jgi:hypothetical protein
MHGVVTLEILFLDESIQIVRHAAEDMSDTDGEMCSCGTHAAEQGVVDGDGLK